MMDIYFRALEINDAELINKLRKIEEMQNLIGGAKRYVSLEREREWVKSLIINDDPSKVYVAICEKETNELVGYTSIADIDFRNGSCFWSGIKTASKFSGKGYGTQTALLVLKYVFEELRMERCIANCLEEHIVAQKMLKKVGFVKEGLMRHYNYKNGGYKNTWLYSILSKEYKEINKKFNYDI